MAQRRESHSLSFTWKRNTKTLLISALQVWDSRVVMPLYSNNTIFITTEISGLEFL
jgi:hypothetical protein